VTWTGHFTVQDVSDGPAPIDVLLTASADEKVKPFKGLGGDFTEHECAALTSNTEGKLRTAELRLVFDEDEAPLSVGALVTVNGHFNRKV
jgi:hypothetical protein